WELYHRLCFCLSQSHSLDLLQVENQSKAEARAGADAAGDGMGGAGGVGAVRAGDEGASGGREGDEDGWECPGTDGQGSGDRDREGHGEADGEGDDGGDGEEDRDGDDCSDAGADTDAGGADADADADAGAGAGAGAGGAGLPGTATAMGMDEGADELDSDSDADDDDDAIHHAFPLAGSSRHTHAVSAHAWKHPSHPHGLAHGIAHGTLHTRGSGRPTSVAVGHGSSHSRGTPSHLPRTTSPHRSAPLSAVYATSEGAAAAAAASGVAALVEAARAMVKQEALEAAAQETHAMAPLPSTSQALPDTAARVHMGPDEPEGVLRGDVAAGAAAAGGGADMAARAAAVDRAAREGAVGALPMSVSRGAGRTDGVPGNGLSMVGALLRGKRGADDQLVQEKTKLLRRFWIDLEAGRQGGENGQLQPPPQHPQQHAQEQREESVPSRAHGGGSGERDDVDVGCTGSAPAHPRRGPGGRDGAAEDAVHARCSSGAPAPAAARMPHATPPDPVPAGETAERMEDCGPWQLQQRLLVLHHMQQQLQHGQQQMQQQTQQQQLQHGQQQMQQQTQQQQLHQEERQQQNQQQQNNVLKPGKQRHWLARLQEKQQEVELQVGEGREQRACGRPAAEEGKAGRGRASDLFGEVHGHVQAQQPLWQQEKDMRYGAAPDSRVRHGGAMPLGSFSLPPAPTARALAAESPAANNAFPASASGPHQHRGLPQTDLNIG
ncbi:unnamed protein product, partial [Closterium sp. NIES-65]